MLDPDRDHEAIPKRPSGLFKETESPRTTTFFPSEHSNSFREDTVISLLFVPSSVFSSLQDLQVCDCKMLQTSLLSGLSALFVSAALAAPSVEVPRQTCEFDSANSPDCWGDYSLSTNWYDEAPDTGVVREFWWEITEMTASPDGFARPVMAINGTIPGPQVVVDWGDTVGE
jgi:hypothetical protein